MVQILHSLFQAKMAGEGEEHVESDGEVEEVEFSAALTDICNVRRAYAAPRPAPPRPRARRGCVRALFGAVALAKVCVKGN